MTREEKAQIIDELKQKFSENAHFYVTDAGGMSVAQVNDFRRLCFKHGIEYKVVKNTFIQKALEGMEADFSGLNAEVLRGFSGVIFAKESASAPARVIKDFLKANKDALRLKGASIDTDLFIGAQHLDTLSKLKSKEELIGEIIGLLNAPMQNVLGSLNSGKNTLAGLVKTLAER
jgi:large subunit ribosomal protein L10